MLLFSISFLLEANPLHNEQRVVSNSNLNEFIDKYIKEQHNFSGLASYYNQVKFYVISENSSIKAIGDNNFNLTPEMKLAVVGRFNVLLLQDINSVVGIKDSRIVFEDVKESHITIDVFSKDLLDKQEFKLSDLKYIHLFYPLASLSRFFEKSLLFFHQYSNQWFWTIIFFSVFIKFLLIPLNILQLKLQNRMNLIDQKLLPELTAIKRSFDGEEAHQKIMAAYKKHGISPFYNLKVLFISLLQVPILISIFNTLGEMPQISNNSFLWIQDWAYPDSIYTYSFKIPLLGCDLNVLPILMTLISVSISYLSINQSSSSLQQNNKLNLYVLSTAFFILFYPFPAIMVWFWIVMNILHLIFQIISNNVKNS